MADAATFLIEKTLKAEESISSELKRNEGLQENLDRMTLLANLRKQSNSELRVKVLETEKMMLEKSMTFNQLMKEDDMLGKKIKQIHRKISHKIRLFKLYDETSKICSFVMESAKKDAKKYFQNSQEITKLRMLKRAMAHVDKKQLGADIQGLEDYEHEVKIENEAMRQALKVRKSFAIDIVDFERDRIEKQHCTGIFVAVLKQY
ncbi:hypothetical protein GUITHDRAFT_136306 [Guillardia theta CCMP2712]|uniref:Uncharacterized protein n=1 Tax=Guillardia theta (strain CCMP2712) TaxID=905079 RepID=L1JLC4_GUITC|nr:hypothetical protein GUITHDRAFT_136306 [Guillardia theta CCMP2712]EKX49142.1 hypothetical protein GUITHDRAFT_136306 [Guillardia theta CCMP2712]|eukprot:XP_005836122.1 hypothetical protein GUITHDRAFT_136306 [Guillardia theta CCMP2712]